MPEDRPGPTLSGSSSLSTLAARRYWIYGGGLAVILAGRLAVPQSSARLFAVSLVLGVMALTYVVELWGTDAGTVASPGWLGLGFVGVVAGLWIVLSGGLPGVLFVAGGLLFCKRALSRPSGESP